MMHTVPWYSRCKTFMKMTILDISYINSISSNMDVITIDDSSEEECDPPEKVKINSSSLQNTLINRTNDNIIKTSIVQPAQQYIETVTIIEEDDQIPTHEKVQTIMEICGFPKKQQAINALALYNYNLEECISRFFDSANTEKQNYSKGKTSDNNPLDISDVKNEYSNLLVLSKEWYQIVQKCQELDIQFVDDQFPPDSSSLDGRRRNYKVSSSIDEKPILCFCGKPVISKTAQSDGPNYGRFYLSCGTIITRKPKRKRADTNNEGDSDHNYLLPTDDESIVHENVQKPQRKCNYFKWDDERKVDTMWSKSISWFRFESKYGCTLLAPNEIYNPSHIRQGTVGNCWFLSALAVVAEKSYLIRNLIPHEREMNDVGCYQVNLCIDGIWKPIIIDSFLPVFITGPSNDNNSKNISTGNRIKKDREKEQKKRLRGSITTETGFVVQPAFAACKHGQIWPALVEKAYAKAHGSYSILNGGFIAEALYDLTGAPTERIHFHHHRHHHCGDLDELWARFLSCKNSGFVMGLATYSGGEGLVACHAYSVLDVIEFNDVIVGEQQKVQDYFYQIIDDQPQKTDSNDKENNTIIIQNDSYLKQKQKSHSGETNISHSKKTTVRLVRIRNPWGRKEWNGAWSSNCEKWTNLLRQRAGLQSIKEGEGTFFMSFEDVVRKFDHVDVAKCQEGWISSSHKFYMTTHGTKNTLVSATNTFIAHVSCKTWTFVSLVQPKKRSKCGTQFWYSDSSLLVFKRKCNSSEEWVIECSVLQGIQRFCNCEIFLDPRFEYCFLPFSHMTGKDDFQDGLPRITNANTRSTFCLTTYSSHPIDIKRRSRIYLEDQKPLCFLHKELMKHDKKIQYILGPKCVLLVIQCVGCVYFVAINSSQAFGLLLNISVKCSKGLMIVSGENNNTCLIPSQSQVITLIVANDGRQSFQGLTFTYKVDSVGATGGSSHVPTPTSVKISDVHATTPISVAGEYIGLQANDNLSFKNGSGSIDNHMWTEFSW